MERERTIRERVRSTANEVKHRNSRIIIVVISVNCPEYVSYEYRDRIGVKLRGERPVRNGRAGFVRAGQNAGSLVVVVLDGKYTMLVAR